MQARLRAIAKASSRQLADSHTRDRRSKRTDRARTQPYERQASRLGHWLLCVPSSAQARGRKPPGETRFVAVAPDVRVAARR
eukprot:792808-Alexandrium_andersonii.AAC.1